MAAFDFPASWGNVNANVAASALPSAFQSAAAFPGALSNLYGSAAQAFTGYGQGLTGLANAQQGNYGAYASGLGNLATAYANQASNRYGANAMAEAARQGALGNIGSAALGAYGSMGGQAMQAWAQNQSAYNNALQSMYGSQQNAMSQLGQSRNSALAGLGNAYATAGAGMAPSTMASNLDLNFSDGGGGGFGGGGYSATGYDGPISTGSYGSGYGGGGGTSLTARRTNTPGSMEQIIGPTFGGLNGALSSLNDSSYADRLDASGRAGMDQLDRQHYSSREMPAQMMGQGLYGLMALGGQAYGNSNRGMDQFYGAMDQSYDPRMYSQIANQLGRGYADSSGRVSASVNALNNGWMDNRAQFDASLQNLGGMYDGYQSSQNPQTQALAQKLYDTQQRELAARSSARFWGSGGLGDSAQRSADRYNQDAQDLQALLGQWSARNTSQWAKPQYA